MLFSLQHINMLSYYVKFYYLVVDLLYHNSHYNDMANFTILNITIYKALQPWTKLSSTFSIDIDLIYIEPSKI